MPIELTSAFVKQLAGPLGSQQWCSYTGRGGRGSCSSITSALSCSHLEVLTVFAVLVVVRVNADLQKEGCSLTKMEKGKQEQINVLRE